MQIISRRAFVALAFAAVAAITTEEDDEDEPPTPSKQARPTKEQRSPRDENRRRTH